MSRHTPGFSLLLLGTRIRDLTQVIIETLLCCSHENIFIIYTPNLGLAVAGFDQEREHSRFEREHQVSRKRASKEQQSTAQGSLDCKRYIFYGVPIDYMIGGNYGVGYNKWYE